MNWKKIGKRLLFPPPILLTLLTLLAIAGMAFSILRPDGVQAVRIAAYTLSFCTLVLLCARIPRMVAFIRRFRRENPFYLCYSTDLALQTRLALTFSFGWNAAYALFQLALGLVYRSAWFYAMAGYYLLLALLRQRLLRQLRQAPPGSDVRTEWRVYRRCGMGLMLMNLSLLVFLLCFVFQLREVRHHEVVVIAMAAYTFSATALAVRGVIRYRRYESPVCSAAKAVTLASALVSMLSLENTMLATFGAEGSSLFRQIMLGASGACISLCILAMAVYMVVHGTKAANSIN